MKFYSIFFAMLLIVSGVASAQVQIDTIAFERNEYGIDTSMSYIGNDGKIHYKMELSDKQKAEISEQVFRKVQDFGNYVEKLWERRSDLSSRERLEFDNYKKSTDSLARELFLGKAEEYYRDEAVRYRVYPDAGEYYYFPQKTNNTRKYVKNKKEIFFDEKYTDKRIIVKEVVKGGPVKIFISSVRNKTGKPKDVYVKEYLRRARTNATYEEVYFHCGGFQIGALEPVKDMPGLYKGVVEYYQDFTGIRGDGHRYADRTYRTVEFEVRLIENDGLAYWDIKLGDIKATKTEAR